MSTKHIFDISDGSTEKKREEERLTSLPSPLKIFHNTHTNCSFWLIPPSFVTSTAFSRSFVYAESKTLRKGLIVIGWGA